MGIFDLFKKKNGDAENGALPKEEGEGTAAPETGDDLPAREEAPAGPAEEAEEEEEEEEEPSAFVPGDAHTAPEDEDIPGVEEAALRRMHALCADRAARIRILDRHIAMLESLKEAFPALAMFPPETPPRPGMKEEEAAKALGQTIACAAKALATVRYRQALQHFNDVETDTLKDAWVLLSYYAAAASGADPAPFIRARKMLDRTLWGRITKEDLPRLALTTAVGKLREGVDYVLQMQEEDWAYMAEIHDRVGVIPGMKAPEKGTMSFISFGITKEEFEWKDEAGPDGVRPRVNQLLDTLLRELPQDRLLASGIIDTAQGNKVTPVPVKPKCPTADGKKLIKWRSALGAKRVRDCETVYVMTSRTTGSRFPMLDPNYAAWVFSAREFADAVVRGNPAFDLRVRSMTQDHFREFAASFAPLGVTSFRWNAGTRDHFCEVMTDDYLETSSAPLGYEGASLNRLILRWRQNRKADKDPAAAAMADTAWNLIAHVLPGTLFLVPFNYKEDVFTDDTTLHVTGPSAGLVNLRALERSLGRRLRPGEKPEFKKVNGVPVLMYDKDMFYGGRDYTLADPRQAALGRPMLFSTVKNGENTYMCGFTDLEALSNVFRANRRVAVLTWDELKRHVGRKNSDGSVSAGLVINPGYCELILDGNMIDDLEKARKEPVKIFMPAKKDPPAGPAKA